MSLKTFHVLFIICSIIIAIWFGFWGINHFQQQKILLDLWAGIASLFLAAGMIVYECSFLKKNKGIR